MIHSLKVNETVILKVNETPFEKFHLQLELRYLKNFKKMLYYFEKCGIMYIVL